MNIAEGSPWRRSLSDYASKKNGAEIDSTMARRKHWSEILNEWIMRICLSAAGLPQILTIIREDSLQVRRNADVASIDRVYRLLAKQYHVDNKDTGNLEGCEIVFTGHSILSESGQKGSL